MLSAPLLEALIAINCSTTGLPQRQPLARRIVAKLDDAAKAENKPHIVHFAEKLMLHAQSEEQVLYPAAILVGEVVREKLAN